MKTHTIGNLLCFGSIYNLFSVLQEVENSLGEYFLNDTEGCLLREHKGRYRESYAFNNTNGFVIKKYGSFYLEGVLL